MQLTGTFPEGIVVDGICYREITLTEHQFRHTMELASDPTTDVKRLEDPVYYQAAILARRLKVNLLPVPVTPDMILELSGVDGDELARVASTLEQQRKAFRDAAQAAPPGPDSPAAHGD